MDTHMCMDICDMCIYMYPYTYVYPCTYGCDIFKGSDAGMEVLSLTRFEVFQGEHLK